MSGGCQALITIGPNPPLPVNGLKENMSSRSAKVFEGKSRTVRHLEPTASTPSHTKNPNEVREEVEN
jgi:hypothetical protein